MITSAWCRVKLADLEHRPVTWKWGPAVQQTADVARKKAAFIRAAFISRSFDWACGAVGWRLNTARDHGFYDQEFSAVYELALAGKPNTHPRVAQYLADLDQTAARIEQMIADAPRRRAEWEAEQVRESEEKAARRGAANAEWQAKYEAKIEAEFERRRQEAAQRVAEREAEQQAKAAKRAHRQAQREAALARAREVAARNREERARERQEHAAERAAEAARQREAAEAERRRRREEQRSVAAEVQQPRPQAPAQAPEAPRSAPHTGATSGEDAPQRPTAAHVAPDPDLILACGCSADHHCEIGAKLEARARRLTAQEIANGRYIRGFDPELHDAGRAVRIAYLWHRCELEHPAILAAAMTGDWCTAPATDGSTGRDQAVRTSVDRSEILEAA